MCVCVCVFVRIHACMCIQVSACTCVFMWMHIMRAVTSSWLKTTGCAEKIEMSSSEVPLSLMWATCYRQPQLRADCNTCTLVVCWPPFLLHPTSNCSPFSNVCLRDFLVHTQCCTVEAKLVSWCSLPFPHGCTKLPISRWVPVHEHKRKPSPSLHEAAGLWAVKRSVPWRSRF